MLLFAILLIKGGDIVNIDNIRQFLDRYEDMSLKLHLDNGDKVEVLENTPSIAGILQVEKPEKIIVNLDRVVWIEYFNTSSEPPKFI
jgi:hypothetical protein